MTLYLKQRFIAAIWFAVFGYLAAVCGLVSDYVLEGHFFSPHYTFMSFISFSAVIIGALLGFVFGHKILLLPNTAEEALRKCIYYGILGGLFALLLIDVAISVKIGYSTYVDCTHLNITALVKGPFVDCHNAFRNSLSITLFMILGSLLTAGWAAVLFGILGTVVLYIIVNKFNPPREKNK